MKKILKITCYSIFLSVVIIYLGVVFLLPKIVNNKTTINKIQSLIFDKTGIETNIIGLNLQISPKLNIALDVDSIDTKYKNAPIFDVKDLSLNYKLLQQHLTLVAAKNIYINGNSLKKLPKRQEKKNTKKFDLNKIPEIHVQNITFHSDILDIFTEDINSTNNRISFNTKIKTSYFNGTVKIGNSGFLQISDDKLIANQLKVELDNSRLYIDGYLLDNNKNPDFSVKGNNLPVSEIMPVIQQIQKAKETERKFIENFKNFKGTANINLKVNKDGIWGTCVGNNLSANAVWFDIPLFVKQAVFNFRGQKVDSIAEGILGKEKVTHTLNITDLLNPQKKLVIGTVKTTLTKKFDYVPNLTVLNSVNINLVYKLKHRKPDVYYNIDIPANSDLIYNSFYLGLRDYKRKIYGNTFKDNSNLYLRKYKYSYTASDKENVIIFGDGLFMKNIDKIDPDKFVPQYITCHTNGYAPISITGSFGEKVNGGEFSGDLKYDFSRNAIIGTFDIIKARHKAFHIEKAHVTSKNGVFNVTSNGLFKGEKYSAEMSLKDNIMGETLVYNMKLLLDKLVFETTPQTQASNNNIDSTEITKKIKDFDITINNWEVIINKIQRDKFVLENVKLIGSMKNNIFNFNMEKLDFADGIISAKGMYDFTQNTSNMTFVAKNINSNKAANMMLNLQNQVEGIANATVNLWAKDVFKYLDLQCAFEIKEGFMPRLGDAEFMFKNSKYKLSEITNFDLTQKDLMKDDIKGTFDVHNTEIKNINITTWHELSAIYLEGNYEMEKQYADLQLFWHYSKEAPKGIRVFGIPIKLILRIVFRPEKSKEKYKSKLSKIPKINATEKNSKYYRIHLNGDINHNKVKIILKEIR